MTLLLGGALRFTEYDYFQEQVVKFIVLKRGEAAGTDRDREFTDWNVLASFVDSFLEAATTAPARGSAEHSAPSGIDKTGRSDT
jgi:menaquinone-dependent protoporphyrinogen oxidase